VGIGNGESTGINCNARQGQSQSDEGLTGAPESEFYTRIKCPSEKGRYTVSAATK
jgi:hypothetical protein